MANQVLNVAPGESIVSLLRAKHNNEIESIRLEKLQIGKSLMPRLSITLGQTASTNSCDTQTWASFGATGTLLDFAATNRLIKVQLALEQAQVKNAIEEAKFNIQNIKNVFTCHHLTELQTLLKELLETLVQLQGLTKKGCEIGFFCQAKLEDFDLTKIENELQATSDKRQLYLAITKDDSFTLDYQSESEIQSYFNQVIDKFKLHETYQKEIAAIKKQSLDNDLQMVRNEYLPKADFYVNSSNNRLDLFHKNWDLRAGITLKWNFFDFGANATTAQSIEYKKQALEAQTSIDQAEKKRNDFIRSIEHQELLNKINEIFDKQKLFTSRRSRAKKLLTFGRSSLYEYLLAEKNILSELISLSKDKAQIIAKIITL